MKELTQFEEKYIAMFNCLADITKHKKALQAQENDIKEALEIAMENHGVTAIDNDIIRINRIAASESVVFDTKAFLAAEPELYRELEKKYNRRQVKKPYVRFTVK